MTHLRLTILGLVLGLAPGRPDATPVQTGTAGFVEASRMSMACLYTIVAYGSRRDELATIVESALDEVDRIDRLMSHYQPESPLSRLNREAARGPVVVERELFEFIARAIGYSVESRGAFDITVGPLMKAWGFFLGDGRIPSDGELRDVRRRVGYRHVVLDASRQSVHFDRPGIELDLGGIAKGYAVDRAVALLRARGVRAALVNGCGSSVFALGAPPGTDGWPMVVPDPKDATRVALTLTLKDRALSVSGSSEKFFEVAGRRYSHIMDPRTGRPVQGVLTVFVLTDDGTTGDALDNALFVLGPKRSRDLLRRHAGVDARFLVEAGTSWKLETLPAEK